MFNDEAILTQNDLPHSTQAAELIFFHKHLINDH